ncbi:MAG: magnesium/cobalt transporter CorA [Nanoarchaeota archaeon]|nr:magnesium/cobalt transporter CorA [Nanoarchaeota archaeon]MBU1945922.1 magnesium/cobalt transporter CorA [Nanoarchaeota archaeon]
MIELFRCKENTVEKLKAGPKELKDVKSPKVFVWIDIFKPTKAELQLISDNIGISIKDLEVSLSEEQRPKIVDLDGPFDLIVFGAPSFESKSITTTPVFIYTSKKHNFVITIRNADTKSISRLKESIETKKSLFYKGSSYFIYRLLDEIINTYFNVLDDIGDKVESIEENTITNHDMKMVKGIFEIKKTLIYFTKSLGANREVVTSIEKEYLTEIDKKTAKAFRTVYNDTIQLIEMSSTQRDILTGLLELQLSAISNDLNKVMKTLTVGATYILIPTLIASIYGMNFKYIPELGWKYGYLFAIGMMVVSMLAVHSYFKKKKWI